MCSVNVGYGENNVNVGPLKEIPQICVDHFHADDLRSTAFFLSHAHTDHMVGLESLKFLRRLNDPGVKLYCHPLTPILLGLFPRYLGGEEGIHRLIRDAKLVPLDAEKPYELEIPGLDSILTVTLLPAGHSPGSVMFLFETKWVRILHTGDFRLTVDDLKGISHLHDGPLRMPKRIDHLYVDTTFCSKSATSFPCRKQVIQKAIGFVNLWLNASQTHWIFIKFAAKFAHEFILIELYKTFGKKIHVTRERKEIYSNIPVLRDVVSDDPRTPFHFCDDRGCLQEGEFLEMRLTSMWYTMGSGSSCGTPETVVRTGKRLNVCYSMHSSLQEIAGTIDYLRPTLVTPLVIPIRSSLTEVKESLMKICKEPFTYKDYRTPEEDEGVERKEELPELPKSIEDVTLTPTVIDEEDECHEWDDENDPNCVEEVAVKYEGKYKWEYNFSPSPTRWKTDSESSESQNICSQDQQ